jgi:hypothetical protein
MVRFGAETVWHARVLMPDQPPVAVIRQRVSKLGQDQYGTVFPCGPLTPTLSNRREETDPYEPRTL